jgi:hypothetical protein
MPNHDSFNVLTKLHDFSSSTLPRIEGAQWLNAESGTLRNNHDTCTASQNSPPQSTALLPTQLVPHASKEGSTLAFGKLTRSLQIEEFSTGDD